MVISGDLQAPESTRRTIRTAAAVLTGLVAVLYVVVFFVQLPHIQETDNPAPAYLFLAALYVVGTLLLARRDSATLQWVGAAVQVVLVALFFGLLALLYREGDESFVLDMAPLAIAVTGAQVVLLGLVAYLAATGHRQGDDGRG